MAGVPDKHLVRLRRGITPALRREVFGGGDDGVCHYCGFVAGEVDHVVPVARGGGIDIENLVPACRECNGEKSDRTVDEWASERRSNGKPWPIPTYVQRIDHLTRHGIFFDGVGVELPAEPPELASRWRVVSFDVYRRKLMFLRDIDINKPRQARHRRAPRARRSAA